MTNGRAIRTERKSEMRLSLFIGFYTTIEEINAYLDTALEGCGLPGKDTTTTGSVH